MINSILRFGLIFIILVLLQVLMFNNIQFSGYVNPYVYIMFILLLPVEIPSWLLLLLSFLTGMIIDFYSGSPGMHSTATVFAGFVRPFILRSNSPRDGYEPGAQPSLLTYGFRWFFLYALVMILVHHTVLFYIEVFRFTDFFRTLLRALLSSFFTLVFVLVIEFYRKGR
jgi:rod shape-determining protein MreD